VVRTLAARTAGRRAAVRRASARSPRSPRQCGSADRAIGPRAADGRRRTRPGSRRSRAAARWAPMARTGRPARAARRRRGPVAPRAQLQATERVFRLAARCDPVRSRRAQAATAGRCTRTPRGTGASRVNGALRRPMRHRRSMRCDVPAHSPQSPGDCRMELPGCQGNERLDGRYRGFRDGRPASAASGPARTTGIPDHAGARRPAGRTPRARPGQSSRQRRLGRLLVHGNGSAGHVRESSYR
jgi:hypothetical protein